MKKEDDYPLCIKIEEYGGYEIYFIPSNGKFELRKDGEMKYHYGVLREIRSLIDNMNN
jgi:hypothetical protein